MEQILPRITKVTLTELTSPDTDGGFQHGDECQDTKFEGMLALLGRFAGNEFHDAELIIETTQTAASPVCLLKTGTMLHVVVPVDKLDVA